MGIDINRVASSALEAALREEPAPRQHHLRGVKTLAAGAALVTAARVGMKHAPRLTELRLVGRGLEKLDHMPNLRDVTDSMRDRFTDYVEDRDDQSEDYDDEDYEDDDYDEDEDDEEEDEDEDDGPSDEDDEGGPTDESEQDEDDEGSEPEAENDQDSQPGDDEESQPEDDEESQPEDDEESQPEAEEDADDEPVDLPLESGSNGSSADGETPDLVGVLGSPRSRAPLVERMAEGIDPAAQPPQAPERSERGQRSQSRRGGRSGSNRKAGSNRNKKSKTARK
jgi:hypothetical protein